MSLRCHSFFFFCHLLCTPREERDRASGYRKRGPKPKRLLLQVTTVSDHHHPTPRLPTCMCTGPRVIYSAYPAQPEYCAARHSVDLFQ